MREPAEDGGRHRPDEAACARCEKRYVGGAGGRRWERRNTYKTARKVSEGREMAAKVRLSIRNNVMLCADSVRVQSVSASLVAMEGGDIRGRSRARLSAAP